MSGKQLVTASGRERNRERGKGVEDPGDKS